MNLTLIWHTSRSWRNEIVWRSKIISSGVAEFTHYILDIAVAQKIQPPTGRVPQNVGGQSPVECSDTAFILVYLSDYSDGTANSWR